MVGERTRPPTLPVAPPPPDDERSDEEIVRAGTDSRFRAKVESNARRTDQLFVRVLGVEAGLVVLAAAIVGQAVGALATYVGFAGLAVTLSVVGPVATSILMPGSAASRHALTAAQMALGIALTHIVTGHADGRAIFFGSLALVVLYGDSRVFLTAMAIAFLDPFVRRLLPPLGPPTESTYWTSLQGLLWLLFEAAFLLLMCARNRKEMHEAARRESELELQTQREVELIEARQASRAKSEFLANMSHEIRTPMTAVIGYADLLLDSSLSERERVSHVKTIRRNGDHLLHVINEILDLSKIEAGKMTVEKIDCAPAELIEDVVSLLRVRAKDKNLDFRVHYAGGVPTRMKTDPTRLRQILMNLVGNAIKFTDSGAVQLLCRTVAVGTREARLELEVNDTGVGLSATQVHRLFQPFTQADSSTTRRFGGTGLGLTICKRLADLLGGDLRVESIVGRGSAFILELPLDPSETKTLVYAPPRLSSTFVAATAAAAAAKPSSSAGDARRAIRGARVLLAEDGIDNQRLISALLEASGVRVDVVDNGRDAVERALANPYDVVLMDMQMPILDGYGAASALRRHGHRGPIVALTAHAMEGDRERCLAAGCDDYLTKPIARADLEQTVARHMQRPPEDEAARDEAPLVSEYASQKMMTKLLVAFVEGLPKKAADLRQAFEAADLEATRMLAHQLKGAGGSYGFPQISEAAAALEATIAGKDRDATRSALDALERLCRRASAQAPVEAREDA